MHNLEMIHKCKKFNIVKIYFRTHREIIKIKYFQYYKTFMIDTIIKVNS